ncbi:hypothetical protein [Marinomonas sp. FW-1]|uniref:hypothetical protein n=1 Tax=Marinomonas sp. FW-1 TaxID=2071621 RepID=UPI0010C07FCA|nr:hypothetical protein [Marinomonas sp. FW-1]
MFNRIFLIVVILCTGCTKYSLDDSNVDKTGFENKPLSIGFGEGLSKVSPQLITLPIGQGLCQVLTCPADKKMMVYDCGSSGANQKLRDKFGLYKWNETETIKAISEIKKELEISEYNILLSHPDIDHYNYISSIILNLSNNFDIMPKNIFYGGDIEDYKAGNTASLLKFLSKNKYLKLEKFNENFKSLPGDEFLELSCPKQKVSTHVLAANVEGDDSNDKSVVLAINTPRQVSDGFVNRYSLLTGDMSSKTLEFMKNNKSINYDDVFVVTAPHHGSFSSYPEGFEDLTQPKWLLVSAGPHLGYGHPRCRTLELFSNYVDQYQKVHRIGCFHDKNGIDFTVDDFTNFNSTEAIFDTFNSGPIILTYKPTEITEADTAY